MNYKYTAIYNFEVTDDKYKVDNGRPATLVNCVYTTKTTQ
jgi:hypothetical protein